MQRSSAEIGVDLFHQTVMLPFRLRELETEPKDSRWRQSFSTEGADHSPLERWVNLLTASGSHWQEADPYFPLDPHSTDPAVDARDREAAYGRLRYAEFAYFHQFARAFLFPTVEDQFHNERLGRDPDQPRNRSIRTLQQIEDEDAVRWAIMFVRDVDGERSQDEGEPPPSLDERVPQYRYYMLRVRRVELHLFATSVGFLTAEFDTRLGPHRDDAYWNQYEDQRRPFDAALGNEMNWDTSAEETFSSIPKEVADDGKVVATFQPGGAHKDNRLTLGDAQLLQDTLRRCFVPYWEFDDRLQQVVASPAEAHNQYQSGHVVEGVVWLNRKGEVVRNDGADNRQLQTDPRTCFAADDWSRCIEETRTLAEPLLFPWWQSLLDPLMQMPPMQEQQWLQQQLGYRSTQLPAIRKNRLFARMLGDDRAACMSYLAVQQPCEIKDGDWMRLAFADGPGDSDCLPYSSWLFAPEGSRNEAFREFVRQYAYDRYYHSRGGNEREPQRGFETRYLVARQCFTVVGPSRPVRSHDDERFLAKPFFIDPVSGLLGHFRYHYFKLMLVAHFHRASLLTFEEELSIAVGERMGDDTPGRGDDNFCRMVQKLRQNLLKFRCRFWFTEITGQQQGQELFAMVTKHLQNERLFEQVNAQLDEAEDVLNRWEEQRKGEFLRVVSVVGVPLLVFGFFEKVWADRPWLAVAVSCGVAVGLFVLSLVYFRRRVKKYGWWIALGILITLLLGSLSARLDQKPEPKSAPQTATSAQVTE